MMRFSACILLTAIGIAFAGAGPVQAVTADPNATIELTQPDGVTKITVRPIGDERTGRLATMDGYTIKKSADGWYTYAKKNAQGKLVASDVRVNDPVSRSIFEESHLSSVDKYLEDTSDRLVPAFEALSSDQISQMTNRADVTINDVLIILIEYPDDTHDYPSSDFEDLMNEPGFDYFGCVNEFYQEISYGQFGVNGTATMWYTAANPRDYYAYGDGDNWTAAAELVKEAVLAADADVDFSLYDNSGDGYVDGIFVVHVGPGAETGNNNYPWSHKWSLNGAGVGQVVVDGKIVNSYSMEPEKNNSTARARIGVFCHEYGHFIGLPDLYDTDYSSIGVGDWCLMSGGSWNGPYGYGGMVPAQMSAWCKVQMGWMTPINVTEEMIDLTIPDVENNPVCYRLWTGGEASAEHFLIEYRQQTLFDTYLPGCGLAIWHIDDDQSGNSNDTHRLVDLEEADRSENNSSGDVWLSGTFGEPDGNPSSDSYSGAPTSVVVAVHPSSCLPGGLVVDLQVGDNACAMDTDSDGVMDCDDICPEAHNPGQADWNSNGIGDACEDYDSDGVLDVADNCVENDNPGQEDTNSDGIGDACCCGIGTDGYTGDTNCDGAVTLSDITRLIDNVYILRGPICCPAAANVNGSADRMVTLSDITALIDHVFISKGPTAPCF